MIGSLRHPRQARPVLLGPTGRQTQRTPSSAPRLLSLDVFRGLTIAAMLLVNHQGQYTAAYAPLRHAEWNGWTPTDLIFPFFLFIVGTALSFSLRKQFQRGAQRRDILLKAARRAAILVALGLLLNSFPWWDLRLSTVRLPGVLQRIGVCYFVAAALAVHLRARAQVIVVSVLLLGYWALLTGVPVPGSGRGILEPGQDLTSFVDRALIGTSHMWPGTWDPEGLLSTVPAVATVLLGLISGQWLQSGAAPSRRIAGLLCAGLAGIALGIAWGHVFPINKNLWTSSFTVFTGGCAAVFLATCYAFVDVIGWRGWARPFVILGVNSIAVYVLASLTDGLLARISIPALGISSLRRSIFKFFFVSWLPFQGASLAFAVAYALAWLAVMAVLHARNVRVTV